MTIRKITGNKFTIQSILQEEPWNWKKPFTKSWKLAIEGVYGGAAPIFREDLFKNKDYAITCRATWEQAILSIWDEHGLHILSEVTSNV